MNFFIGQRVRVIAAAPVCSQYIGAETRIVGDRGDVWVLDLQPRSGFSAVVCFKREASERLAPILPSGAQPSEFTTLHDLLTSLEGVAA
jgi:hypothetical protein